VLTSIGHIYLGVLCITDLACVLLVTTRKKPLVLQFPQLSALGLFPTTLIATTSLVIAYNERINFHRIRRSISTQGQEAE
jgi:hypothetical protein